MIKEAIRSVVLISCLACSGGAVEVDAGKIDSGNVIVDAGQTEDATVPPEDGGVENPVEIGTGVEAFAPLTEDQQVEITLGPQGGGACGGYHIWHSVRAKGFNPNGITMLFRTFLADSQQMIATQERRANLQPEGGGAYVAYGVAPWLRDCCQAEDADLIMSVRIEDMDGKIGEDQVRVHTGLCLDSAGARICPAQACP